MDISKFNHKCISFSLNGHICAIFVPKCNPFKSPQYTEFMIILFMSIFGVNILLKFISIEHLLLRTSVGKRFQWELLRCFLQFYIIVLNLYTCTLLSWLCKILCFMKLSYIIFCNSLFSFCNCYFVEQRNRGIMRISMPKFQPQ